AHADTTQAGLRRALDRLGLAYTPYYLVNAIEVEGGLPVRLWLSLRPEVDRVLVSPALRPTAGPLAAITGEAPPPTEPVWNVTAIGADRAWRDFGARGQGIVVGQSDSGVQLDHPALADRYQGAQQNDSPTHDYHWFDPWYGSPAPVDYDGHGTHTLGTVLGEQTGVAPDATWIACANLVRNLGNPAKYLDCMQFMLAPFPLGGDPFHDGDPARAADVLNNSWGCPPEYEGCDAQVFAPAVAALRAAGIFVVASAGNAGPLCGTVADPIALYDAVVTVGAVDRGGNLAAFSSAGPVTVDGSGRIKPDLAAPGVDILSAFPNSSYATASGTSMAGPHVAGVVALMWSANPVLIGDIARTETLLLEATRPFTGSLAPLLTPEESEELAEVAGEESLLIDLIAPAPDPAACVYQVELDERPNNAVGYGVVDAYRAVELARSARPRP
ncbi:MAG TPA: S8 family serine peptidase, partial [Caldilineaceae bacterium]|nr:S8 family serine peptidase [Caldilineaceae bacterium]